MMGIWRAAACCTALQQYIHVVREAAPIPEHQKKEEMQGLYLTSQYDSKYTTAYPFYRVYYELKASVMHLHGVIAAVANLRA